LPGLIQDNGAVRVLLDVKPDEVKMSIRTVTRWSGCSWTRLADEYGTLDRIQRIAGRVKQSEII